MELWIPHKKGLPLLAEQMLLALCKHKTMELLWYRWFLTAHWECLVMLGVERKGSGWPKSFLPAVSEPHGCFCSRISAGTCAPAGFLAEVWGLGVYKATQPLCLPNAAKCRSQPGLGFVAGLGACTAKDSGFGLHLSVYLYNDRKSKFLTSKYESKQKHCEGQLSTAVRWCYPSHSSTLKLPYRPEGLLGKSPEKMPAGKPPTDTQLASQNNWSLNVWHSAPGTAAGHSPATEQYQGFLIKFSNRNTGHGKHCCKS